MLKYVNCGIVFQEIPNEVTLSINISNCPCRCPGCHSKYLWDNIGQDLNEDSLDELLGKYMSDITCVCLMGGDAAPQDVVKLARHIRNKYSSLHIGWYSGRLRISPGIDKNAFDYIKIGPYIKHLGSLRKRTTNQRLYKKVDNEMFEDITSLFWK